MSKRTLSIVALLATAITANAQSLLRVHLADNSRINVSVNGRYFNRQGTTVTVGDLPPGRHLLKIYNITYDRWGRAYDRLVFQGTVNTSMGMVTNFLFDPRTRTMSANRNPIDNSRNAYRPNQPNDNYREYGSDNDNNRYEQPTAENAVPELAREEEKNTVASLPAGTPAASPVPEGTFTDAKSDKIKAKVDAKATDTEKLRYMKEVLKNETVTTFQVSYMMDWFLFESTKVDFAKWAYSITTDKDFYDDLSSKFNYASSKEDFKKFISSRK
jgi:hypothetical protein